MYASEMYYQKGYKKVPGAKKAREEGMGYAYETDGHHVDAIKLGKQGKVIQQLHFDLPSYQEVGNKRYRKTPYPMRPPKRMTVRKHKKTIPLRRTLRH